MTFQLPKGHLQESGAYAFDVEGARLYASATEFEDGEEVSFRVDNIPRPPNENEIRVIRDAFWRNRNDMIFVKAEHYLQDVVSLRSMPYLKNN